MILHKETYKAFGYYPEYAKYHDLIIYKCYLCSGTRITTKGQISRKKDKRREIPCKYCAGSINIKKARSANIYKAEIRKGRVITDKLVADIMFSASVRSSDRRAKTIKFNKNRQPSLLVGESLEFYKTIGLGTKTPTTYQLKKQCCNYLCSLPKTKLFNILNYILNTHRSLSRSSSHSGEWYAISDKFGFIKEILTSLNFKYKQWNTRSKSIRIISGSFFINNQWIHIG